MVAEIYNKQKNWKLNLKVNNNKYIYQLNSTKILEWNI
jgi:hypothetical protein